MRCLLKSAFVMLVACGAGVAFAGPLDRTAASKANGDMIGHPATAPAATMYRNYTGNTNRSFSYAPAPSAAQAVPAPPVQAAAPRPAVRRYSYQPMQQVYRAPQSAEPSYLRLDRKVLGTY